MIEKTKINEKEAVVGPFFFKKTCLNYVNNFPLSRRRNLNLFILLRLGQCDQWVIQNLAQKSYNLAIFFHEFHKFSQRLLKILK